MAFSAVSPILGGGSYVDQMFNETTARTSETQMLSGTGTVAGTYSPIYDGTLIFVSIGVSPQAATSLCQSGHVKLIQGDWKPNTIIFPFWGFGLATAPQSFAGGEMITTYATNLGVKTQKKIDSLLIEFDSPVTPRVRVVGTFIGTS